MGRHSRARAAAGGAKHHHRPADRTADKSSARLSATIKKPPPRRGQVFGADGHAEGISTTTARMKREDSRPFSQAASRRGEGTPLPSAPQTITAHGISNLCRHAASAARHRRARAACAAVPAAVLAQRRPGRSPAARCGSSAGPTELVIPGLVPALRSPLPARVSDP
jgi:hypothetical protein